MLSAGQDWVFLQVLIFENYNKPSKPDLFCWFLLSNSSCNSSCTLQYHYLSENCILEIYFTLCQSGLMHSLDSEIMCLSINRLNWKLPKYLSVQCSHSLTHPVMASGWGRRIILEKLGWDPELAITTLLRIILGFPHFEHTPLWRSGWLGLFSCFLWLWAQRGYCRLCTAHEALVLWVSGWKVSSDAFLPAQNSKVCSASPCNCVAAELSCGLWIHSGCSFALVLYDVWHWRLINWIFYLTKMKIN